MKSISLNIFQEVVSYDLRIGEGFLRSSETISYIEKLGTQFVIFCSEEVKLTCTPFLLEQFHHSIILIALSGRETIKTRGVKEWVEDRLIQAKYGRDCCILAIGGGTLLDLAGFVASTYCRGVPYVAFPTTLLAMTDAAIGGKTGVNISLSKNYIGTFYHPKRIYIDLETLKTLPQEEFVSGFIETFKHALLCEESFFFFLEDHIEKIFLRDFKTLLLMIEKSCFFKASIVCQDPFERKNLRALLNLGHTIGHALESFSEYQLRHGEAVAIGLWIETFIAVELGELPMSIFKRIEDLLFRVSMPLQKISQFDPDQMWNYLKMDKKSIKNNPRFVLLKHFGKAELVSLTEYDLRKGMDYAVRHFEAIQY
jgi:3-dehydroquinate synthase